MGEEGVGLWDKLPLFQLDSGLLRVEEVEAVVYEETKNGKILFSRQVLLQLCTDRGEEIVLTCVPVEEEVNRDSAQVPGSVSVQHPEERWEVEELKQRQAM